MGARNLKYVMFCLGITVYTPTIVCHKISIFILFYNLLEVNWILELSFQVEILLLINLIIEPETNYMKFSVINICIIMVYNKMHLHVKRKSTP